MMQKVFFFDIDGTLAINHHVPENNLKILQSLKDKGHLTFICTGRAPFYAKKLFGDLVSGYICCNGRYIIYNNQKLHGEVFSDEQLQWYLARLKANNWGALLVSDHVSMNYELSSKEVAAMKSEYGIDRIMDYDPKLPVYTLDIFYHNFEQLMRLMETFKDNLVINDHGGSGNCDCSTIGYDKGNAIAYILKYFGIAKENAYAFGDGYNDQAMFREVANRIAMGNAVAELKKQATYVTNDVDKDGIYQALVHEKIL